MKNKLLIYICMQLMMLTLSAEGSQKVLILNSYSYCQSWTRSITEALMEAFADDENITLSVEFMDSKMFHSPEYYRSLYESYMIKYGEQQFDVIITSDDNAVNFVLDHREVLFNNAPVIFCGVNNLDLPDREDFYNISGVLEVPGYRGTIDGILEMFPLTEKIYLINESSTTGMSNRAQLEAILTEYSGQFESVWLEGFSEEEILKTIGQLEEDSVVILLSYFINRDSGIFNISDGAQFISSHTDRPVFSMWEFFLGEGIVGGMLTSGTYQGKTAAEKAREVLSGADIHSIPISVENSNIFMFDYDQLQRFGIAKSQLPQGSIVINEQSREIYRYRKQLIFSLSVISALLILCFFLVVNVREKKKAEMELGRANNSLTYSQEVAKLGHFFMDVKSHGWRNSQELNRIFGIDETFRRDLDGWLQLFHGDYRDEIRESLMDLKSHGDKILNKEFRIVRNEDSEERWAYIKAHMVVNRERNKREIFGIVQDITDQKQLQVQLTQSQKMDAIGKLAGGIAHDFNNMLGGIIGSAELLEHDLDDQGLKEYTSIILYAAEHASQLSAKLLTFSRKKSNELVPADLHKIIQDSVDILANTMDKRISIHTYLNAEDPIIEGDSSTLQSLLLNLGINAANAMENGGDITISTGKAFLDDEFCNNSSFDIEPGDYIKIGFQDTGCGITRENLPRIFEPFFTTAKENEGTGLGLATVFGTVQQHCGAISVYSKVNRGTSFHIFIPLSKEELTLKDISEPLLKGHGTILVIDDEFIMRKTAQAQLTQLGYRVELAKDGLQGLSLYRENPHRYDVVILDMIMPRMNGYDCFLELKEINEEVKVILSSGFTREEVLKQMYDKGLKGLVNKPYKKTELSHILFHVLNDS